MNAPNVRSVTVRLNAEVAKYIADMKAAGKATDDAFSRAHTSVDQVDTDLQSATKSADAMGKQTRDLERDTAKLGNAMGKTAKATKQYSLETAIAEERTKRLRQTLRDQARAALDAEVGMHRAASAVDRTTVSVDRAGSGIDRLSGRLSLLLKLGATAGPGLIPAGAVGIAGIAGLASQLGFAAIGITTLVVASQGLGDALKAVEKARLDPTIDNLVAAREAMKGLAPEAQAFVTRFQQLRPVLKDIRNSAAGGWFPGLTEALDHFEDVGPRVGEIFRAIGETGGSLVADAAEALAGPEWADFLDFVETEAPSALEDLGHTAGNLVSGLAQVWMAFSPVNNDFSDWLLDASQSFEDWASNLSQTDGFREFVDYLRANGPKVADAAAAIGDALLQIVQAAAPLGGPVLEAITRIFDAIADIADSPLGTPIMTVVTAISAISLVSKISTAALTRLSSGLAVVGAQGPRTAAALNLIHKSLLALAAVEIGTAIKDGLANQLKGAGPEVDKLAASFDHLNSSALTDELGGSLSELLDASKEAGGLEAMASDMSDLVESAGVAGDVITAFAPGIDTYNDNAEKAAEATTALDGALVSLVDSAGPGGAQRAFQDMAKAQGLSVDETDELLKILPGYRDALKAAGLTTDEAADSTGRLALESRRAAREQLQQARAAARLKEAMKEQRETVNETAEAWSDYSQKVQLGKTSTDQLMNRWNKLGEASANMAENIQVALGRGLDADIIKDVIDTLGPQGAALALEQFANASGAEAHKIEADFRRMGEGIGDFKSSYDLLLSLLSGNPLTLGTDIIFELDAAKAAFDSLPKDVRTEIRAEGIPQTEAEVDALVDKYRLTERERKALITLLDHASPTIQGILGLLAQVKDKHVTVTTTYIRELITKKSTIPQSPPGGGDPLRDPVGGADGMTVPGPRQPYGDKVLAYLAPGEEVITNRRGEADRFRADRAAGRIPAYADGGTVDPVVLTRGGDNPVEREARRTGQALKGLRNEVREAEKAVEKERRQRDALVSRMDEIRGGISGGLTTQLGGSNDAWASQYGGSTFAGNLSTIRGDTRNARRFARLERILREKGFDGAALEDLLSRGDINEVADYATRSRRDLREYEKAFNERARYVRGASRVGADAALGDELREANRRLHHLEQLAKHGNDDRQQGNRDRKDEHGKDRNAQRRGAGNGARNKRRD